ncbi:MAG: type III-A CRISPR-associated RAMP protein Csm4 [Bryobacteraceae bacterium]
MRPRTVNPALIVKFHPAGPWRPGPDSGAASRVDSIFHSDTLYSAITSVMAPLGSIDEWLDATARSAAGPAVSFSSCFPFRNETGFVVPPQSIWPPPLSSKVRWKGARFVPLPVVDALLAGDALDEDRWTVDGASECLLALPGPGASADGPFRIAVRSGAAVDRLGGAVAPHTSACLEFAPGAGMWCLVSFAGEAARDRWNEPLRTAIRLLGDTGLGGRRALGWGRFEKPEFIEGSLPELILPRACAIAPPATPVAVAAPGEASFWEPAAAAPSAPAQQAYWLLSLVAPAAADAIEWERGSYRLVTRGGRVSSPAGSGALKKLLNMLAEGSVLVSSQPIRGAATDVAPDGFPHPVFRAGFAVAVPIPQQAPA